MKTNQHTAEQIIKILEQAERDDQSIGAVCREHGIAEATFYRWRKSYHGMRVQEVQRLKELEKENARLKRLLAGRMLEVDALKELLAKKKMSLAERRAAVNDLVALGRSVQRACQLVQRARATFRYQARTGADDDLIAELHLLAERYPRYGYRRAWACVRRKRPINRKRVHRVWKQAQLQVKRRARRRAKTEQMVALVAAYPNHIWACDFVQDHDLNGNTLYFLTVIDEFSRAALAVDVELKTSRERVISVFGQLVARFGTPTYVRSDNGAEFVATSVQYWLVQHKIVPLRIAPGCPWQNGKDERFNGTLRDECLNMYLFANLVEARSRVAAFQHYYNVERPHSRLDYRTPVAFKQAWNEAQLKQQDSLIPT